MHTLNLSYLSYIITSVHTSRSTFILATYLPFPTISVCLTGIRAVIVIRYFNQRTHLCVATSTDANSEFEVIAMAPYSDDQYTEQQQSKAGNQTRHFLLFSSVQVFLLFPISITIKCVFCQWIQSISNPVSEIHASPNGFGQ